MSSVRYCVLSNHSIACLASSRKVRFAFELLCALQPGTSIMALHGKCKHARRTQIYLDFLRKPGAVLLATDIAARGLDFPSVDWVIQVLYTYTVHICTQR